MPTEDFMLDEVERSQRQQKRRRSQNRTHRRRIYLLFAVMLIGLVILSAPSLLCRSSFGRSMVRKTAAEYGLDVEIDSMRVGWITPLSIQGVQVNGTVAGSRVTVASVDTALNIRDLISASTSDFGEVIVRGVEVRCSISQGRSSLEDDLQELMQPSDQPSSSAVGRIEIQDAAITVTDTDADTDAGAAWQLTQSNATVALNADAIHTTFAGVLHEPSGNGGSLQGNLSYRIVDSSPDQSAWELNLDSESLPLSVVTLLCRRFPVETEGMPSDLSGDATGSIRAIGYADGNVEADLQTMQIRNLRATEPLAAEPLKAGVVASARVWTNQLATFDGHLVLDGNRVIGRDLTAQADFASATLNGAFSRSITLAGENNNPMRWLEALDGTARAEIDLALLDRAMPGLMPLRSETQIVSGRAIARIDSRTTANGRTSQLTLQSDPLHARAHGRAVVLEPIEITTTVLDDGNNVRAETLKWNSSFAKAVGEGDLQSGQVDFQVDFGRLSAVLRPIIEMSDTSFGGTAKGNFQWNASNRNVWRLSGDADASNLLVTLPSGQGIKRNSLNAKVEAVGRWGGKSLEELTGAEISLTTNGLNVDAELSSPVSHPSGSTPMPIEVTAQGRMETLAETIGPWLPKDVHDVQGGFELKSRGEFSAHAIRLADTTVNLTDPRIAYADRWFSQKDVQVNFQGEFDWPSGSLDSQSLTLAGEAVSLAMKGNVNANDIDLEIAWRAKLDRIQGSVRKRVANWRRQERPASKTTEKEKDSVFRHVGFQSNANARSVAQSDDWLVTGDCEGNFRIKLVGDELDIVSSAVGRNVAVIQPPDASAQSYTVGPMPQRSGAGSSYDSVNDISSRVVWAEPNVSITGPFSVSRTTGKITANGVRIAGDWFDTTLTGHALWNETLGDVALKGPASLKMDEVSRRLTTLTQTQIDVKGVKETPLEIHAATGPDGNVAFTVRANVGWDLGEIAGVSFGAATVPVRLTETTVEISPSSVPVGQGQVNLAGEVSYRPGPIWLRVEPGTVATNLRLTPEMTSRWLKYLTPVAAQAAQVDGTMSVELDEAIVVIDTPELSRVKGRINIEEARMTAGPLTAQLIGGLDQLKSLASQSLPRESNDPTTLITLPSQTVDFALNNGVVSHQRLFFDIDRAHMMSSGQVDLNSRVNLVAQVELDERWLGSDLQGLAGNSVSLPIKGTLSQPMLDPVGIRDLVVQLGKQAAAKAAEEVANGFIQQQFGKGFKGLDKGFKDMNDSVEKQFNKFLPFNR